MTIAQLLAAPPNVINVGAATFADALVAQGAKVVDVRWSPPPSVPPEIARLLEKLM